MRKPPTGVDVLLMEGTNLRPEGDPKSGKTEQEIEKDLIQTFKATSGIVLAMYSAQNIDRLVTMFRACIQSGRHLVLDLYAASIAAATGNPNIPKAGFEKLLVYVPLRQRIQVKESREFERVASIKSGAHLSGRTRRASTGTGAVVQDLDDVRDRGSAMLEWRLCRLVHVARLPRTAGSETIAEFPRAARHSCSLPTMRLGTRTFRTFSGLATAIAPGRLVPIHSFAPDRFGEFFENVEVHRDGEWWDV